MPRRRFQKGTFIKVKDGGMYSMHYIDVVSPDGTATTKQKKQFIGNIRDMSERAVTTRARPHHGESKPRPWKRGTSCEGTNV